RAVGDGNVLAQTQRVELIDPVVIVEIRIGGHRRFELWSRPGGERPALPTPPSGCFPAAPDLAVASVGPCDMTAAAERVPDQAVPIDVDAARTETPLARLNRVSLEGRLIHLCLARLGRVRAKLHPDDAARHRSRLARPDRSVLRVRDDPVVEAGDA